MIIEIGRVEIIEEGYCERKMNGHQKSQGNEFIDANGDAEEGLFTR